MVPDDRYTRSLHDALPISPAASCILPRRIPRRVGVRTVRRRRRLPEVNSMKAGIHPVYDLTKIVCVCGNVIEDRKSTRLNSSHQIISYAVFCLKKKTV